jgi:hypothetical protein
MAALEIDHRIVSPNPFPAIIIPRQAPAAKIRDRTIRAFEAPPMSETAAGVLREDHERIEKSMERLRQIADALDCCEPEDAATYILEANKIVGITIVKHEREDEETIYPRVSEYLADAHGLSALSRAHREILHQARLLARLADGLRPQDIEPYLMRDA